MAEISSPSTNRREFKQEAWARCAFVYGGPWQHYLFLMALGRDFSGRAPLTSAPIPAVHVGDQQEFMKLNESVEKRNTGSWRGC